MKKIICLGLVLLLFIGGSGVSGFSENTDVNKNSAVQHDCSTIDDISAYRYQLALGQSKSSRIWSIIETFPIIADASGLAYDGTYLYCGIYGVLGSNIYQINPQTGSYSLLFSGPQDDTYGLTYDGEYLWVTDHPGGSSTPAIAMKLDWDGTVLYEFNLPTHYMSGIAYDNGDFWVAQYYPDPSVIYKVDTSGTILQQFTAPDNQPWDLCIENEFLWMADYWGDTLYKINKTTGALVESHGSEKVDPAGIVWDGQYLWYCDDGEGANDFLYKVDLLGGGTPAINVVDAFHNYGPVTVGESITWNATVQNIGTAPLVISDVTISGSPYVTCPVTFPITITPGNQTLLPLVFAPLEYGPLNANASIFSNDPLHPTVQINVVGNAMNPGPDIYFPETSHNYGSVRLHAFTRWFLEIANLGDQTVVLSDISSDDTHFTLDEAVTFPISIDILSSVKIGIWFYPEDAITYSGTLTILSNDPDESPYYLPIQGTGVSLTYPIGETIWQYQIPEDSIDNSPKAMISIDDINGDGINDLIICSEDDYARCLNGNSHENADVLWEAPIGSVYSQLDVARTEDINGDGYHDVVIGTAWGGRSIITLSGKTGQIIWQHDTHEYGGGGWVYQVDCRYDYNNDGTVDVLAATGDDSSDTGPKRVYCLNGVTGVSLWECPLNGPVFSVIGIEDCTNDGAPDVVAGASNEAETIGKVVGINGATGSSLWTYTVTGSSVWALEQIDDISGDGVEDIIAGDFVGYIYGLGTSNGAEIWQNNCGYVIITRFAKLDDVNGDTHPDIMPALLAYGSGHVTYLIDGSTGGFVWNAYVADKPAMVERIDDITWDGINDVVVGTLYTDNNWYFLDGVDGTTIQSGPYSSPIDAITTIPDIVGDSSMELIVGGRYGYVTCHSGGLRMNILANFSADTTQGPAPLTVHFLDESTAENTTINSWKWDFDNDGTIDSEEQNPTWIYEQDGTYTVSLTISDGVASDTETKENFITVFPMENMLTIANISGGLLKITAEIQNPSSMEVTDVNWSISLNGGLILLGKQKSNSIQSIAPGDSVLITDKPIIGIGKINIAITVEAPDIQPVTKTADGFVFLFYIIIR
jgi:PKD repeat protein